MNSRRKPNRGSDLARVLSANSGAPVLLKEGELDALERHCRANDTSHC